MYLGTGPLQRLDRVAWVTQAQIQRYDWHPDTMRQSEHGQHRQRDDRVRTLGEGSHLRAKEGGQGGNQRCQHLGLRLPDFSSLRKQIVLCYVVLCCVVSCRVVNHLVCGGA